VEIVIRIVSKRNKSALFGARTQGVGPKLVKITPDPHRHPLFVPCAIYGLLRTEVLRLHLLKAGLQVGRALALQVISHLARARIRQRLSAGGHDRLPGGCCSQPARARSHPHQTTPICMPHKAWRAKRERERSPIINYQRTQRRRL
jgi:hypothetical protein